MCSLSNFFHFGPASSLAAQPNGEESPWNGGLSRRQKVHILQHQCITVERFRMRVLYCTVFLVDVLSERVILAFEICRILFLIIAIELAQWESKI